MSESIEAMQHAAERRLQTLLERDVNAALRRVKAPTPTEKRELRESVPGIGERIALAALSVTKAFEGLQRAMSSSAKT